MEKTRRTRLEEGGSVIGGDMERGPTGDGGMSGLGWGGGCKVGHSAPFLSIYSELSGFFPLAALVSSNFLMSFFFFGS